MCDPFGAGTSVRERKSTQRESNPHFRHGKPVGFRYIMGANVLIGLSKNRVESTATTALHGGARQVTMTLHPCLQ